MRKRKQEELPRMKQAGRGRFGLRGRMTLSYILVTVVAALVAELLLGSIIFVLLTQFASGGATQLNRAQIAAQWYALAAAAQASGTELDPHTTFTADEPASITIPSQVTTPIAANDPENIALLIAPNGRVVASTYPAHYPLATPVTQLVARHATLITQALQGIDTNQGTNSATDGQSAVVTTTVWSKARQPMGAIYVQATLNVSSTRIIAALPWIILTSTLLFLIIFIPIGAFFGPLTTRSLVRRIQRLALATTQFAGGDDDVRVPVLQQDEVGQLEAYFNQMAAQLVESSAQQQQLQEQNARLAERARITRELHDAISQSLFSLRMLAGGLQASTPEESPIKPQITTIEQTTATMIREMRALLLELRPTQLEHLGLAEAIEDLAAAYRARLGITVTTTLTTTTLPSDIEHALLRIVQEALANAARHASATAITLELTLHSDMITLSISDNGSGFTQDARQQQHGVGLRSMQERIAELNGTLTIETAPGQGTQIAMHVPYTQSQQTQHEEEQHYDSRNHR